MTPPKHIWSGNWESESEEDARRRAEAEAERRAHPQPDPAEAPTTVGPAARPALGATAAPAEGAAPRRGIGRGRLAALAAVAALIVGGGAFAAGTLLDGGDDGNQKIARPAALPAVPSKPITPSRGQTRAGAIYAQASPAVVSIKTASGSGTGFLLPPQGTLGTHDPPAHTPKTLQGK